MNKLLFANKDEVSKPSSCNCASIENHFFLVKYSIVILTAWFWVELNNKYCYSEKNKITDSKNFQCIFVRIVHCAAFRTAVMMYSSDDREVIDVLIDFITSFINSA